MIIFTSKSGIMKLFVLGILFFSTLLSVAQLPKKLKYDKLTYSFDSTTVLIQKGTLQSVYDLEKGRYIIEATKSRIINFQHSNNYAEVQVKTNHLWIYQYSDDNITVIKGNDSLCYVGFSEHSGDQKLINLNGKIVDKKENQLFAEQHFESCLWSQYKIEKISNGVYLVNSYESPKSYVNEAGVWVYESGFDASGVYDFNSNAWLIKPVYKTCSFINNFVFCLLKSNQSAFRGEKNEPVHVDFHYDIFELADGKLNLVLSQVKELNPDQLAHFLGMSSFINLPESNLYISSKNGKWGLMELSLFETAETYGLNWKYWIQPNADFIYYEPSYELIAALSVDSVQRVRCYFLENDSLIEIASDPEKVIVYLGSNTLNDFCAENSHSSYSKNWQDEGGWINVGPESDCKKSLFTFGIEYLNDSLFILSDFIDDSEQLSMKSILYAGEDSTDAEGNVMYLPKEPGYQRTGVYNLNSNQWLIPNNYVKVLSTPQGYLVLNAVRDQSAGTLYDFNYVGFDLVGNLIFENQSEKDLFASVSNLELIVPFANVVEIFDAPDGFKQHASFETEQRSFYVRNENKMLGIYSPGENFENNYADSLYEFIHYNPTLNFTFIIDGDSMRFQAACCNAVFAASLKNGKISFSQHDVYGDPVGSYLVTIEEGDSTTEFGELMSSQYPSITQASIEMVGPYLVVTDHTNSSDQSCIECYNSLGFFYNKLVQFESENSSVWIKTDYFGWEKYSPYYATINPVNENLFIAKTGFYYEETMTFSEEIDPVGKVNNPSRYLLLDSTLQSIPYMDYFDFAYIEDLGFGLKVQLNEGDKFFFMTYDLVAVTNAEWDHFELENGKLKAIINTQFEIDPETGEFIYNEFGTPNELVSSTTKYFKLP